jgi:cytosine/adenosine deaminase-related metal-dependent hydrolase
LPTPEFFDLAWILNTQKSCKEGTSVADVLIENATVITIDRSRRVIENGAVAIGGHKIVGVGPTTEVKAAHTAPKVINGRGKIVIPGLVDLYAHAGSGMLKSLGEQLAGVGWWHLMDEVLFNYVTPEWWYVESQLIAAERLRFGCTAVLTQPGLSHARLDELDHIKECGRAFEDAGMRAALIAGMPRSTPWVSRYSDMINGRRFEKSVAPQQVLDNLEAAVAEGHRQRSDLVRWWVGWFIIGNPSMTDADNPVNPFRSDLDIDYFRSQAERLRALQERFDTGFWAHCWSDGVTHAYDAGFRALLGPRTVLSHCTRLDDRSLDILAETRTNVNHCPRARRLQMWHETCRIVEMLDRGVNVGLGSDAPQLDRNGDSFMDMQMALRVQRRRFKDPGVLPAGKLLELSTINGYRALGLDHVGGSLEVGKDADVVVVDVRKPHIGPLTMPVHQLVYYGVGTDVEHVFVRGKHVVNGGKVTSIDERRLMEQADEEMRRLMSYPELRLSRLAGVQPSIWQVREKQVPFDS